MALPHGRAYADPSNPRAWASCDRCADLVFRHALQAEVQWMGQSIKPTGFLVCDRCFDIPNESIRSITLPPDPVPVVNPRPVQYGDES